MAGRLPCGDNVVLALDSKDLWPHQFRVQKCNGLDISSWCWRYLPWTLIWLKTYKKSVEIWLCHSRSTKLTYIWDIAICEQHMYRWQRGEHLAQALIVSRISLFYQFQACYQNCLWFASAEEFYLPGFRLMTDVCWSVHNYDLVYLKFDRFSM